MIKKFLIIFLLISQHYLLPMVNELKEAVETNNKEKVIEILKSSYQTILNANLGDGQTALFLALEKGNIEIIKELIKFCLLGFVAAYQRREIVF